jgi:hypothetical protein
MKATHNGHCQICGRQQALPNGRLSKHGYTVDWGYFNGVCTGANHAPLEESRELTDNVIVSLREYADEQERRAEDCADPDRLETCTIKIRDGYRGRRAVYKMVTMTRDEFESPKNAELRRYGVTWAHECQAEQYRCLSQAKSARNHADAMVKLADKIHGQPLQPREDDSKPQRKKESFYDGTLREQRVAVSQRRKELEEQGATNISVRRDRWGGFNMYYTPKS